MKKVLITAMTLAELRGRYYDILKEAGFEIAYPPRAEQVTEEELLLLLNGVQATLAGSEPYTPRVFASHPSLKVVARCGVGFDAVDVAAATNYGVAVATTPGTNHDAVAEHTFALILALAKNIVGHHNRTVANTWPRQTNIPLRGRTLGIAGLGRIGKAVALRGECFGMRLLAYETMPDLAFAKEHGIALVPFEQLLAEADFLSLHMPLTPQSRQVINRRTLALMKPTAFFINTARGGLVVEADLLEALRAGKLAGAGLDVFENEPSRHNPLYQLDNVVVTPHTAGGDFRSRDDMAASAAGTIAALSRGQWPEGQIVNPEVRSKFRWPESSRA